MKQRGFNLIEILFALLLLGLVITVSVETSSGDLAGYNRARDTTLARWVAFNQLAEMQTGKREFPPLGETTGKAAMGGFTWQWQQVITAMPAEPNLRKVTVKVFPAGKPQQVMAVEVAYIANPQAGLPNNQGNQP